MAFWSSLKMLSSMRDVDEQLLGQCSCLTLAYLFAALDRRGGTGEDRPQPLAPRRYVSVIVGFLGGVQELSADAAVGETAQLTAPQRCDRHAVGHGDTGGEPQHPRQDGFEC
jgi:hypothetical protein